MMQKHRWITSERLDKYLSPLYWCDVNLRSALYGERSVLLLPLLLLLLLL